MMSSLFKKYLMALSGFILVGFVLGHMIGNLQVFPALGGAEAFNDYAYKLHNLPYGLLWVARGVLLAAVVVHIWVAILLVLENKRARPLEYKSQHYREAGYAARTMKWSGPLLLLFIIYHLLHFTVHVGPGADYADTDILPQVALTKGGHKVIAYMDESQSPAAPVYTMTHDAYGMVIAGFSKVPVSIFYIVAMAFLCLHLAHGVSSMFQSLGLRNKVWRRRLNAFAIAYGWVIFLGFISIPLSVMTGLIS